MHMDLEYTSWFLNGLFELGFWLGILDFFDLCHKFFKLTSLKNSDNFFFGQAVSRTSQDIGDLEWFQQITYGALSISLKPSLNWMFFRLMMMKILPRIMWSWFLSRSEIEGDQNKIFSIRWNLVCIRRNWRPSALNLNFKNWHFRSMLY